MQQPYPGSGYPSPPNAPQDEVTCLRKDYNYIGLMMIFLIIGLRLAYSLLAGVLVVAGVLELEQLNQENLGLDNTRYLLIYASSYILAMGVPAVVISLCLGRRQFPLAPAKPCRGGAAFFGVLFGVGGCMLANVVTNLLLLFLSRFDIPIPETPQMMVNTPLSLLLGLVVMALLPALLEEMVFRGYVLRTLRPYGDWYAVVFSSILFSLMHGNIRQIPFALFVGMVLGWLYTATDNIWIPVAVHFGNNAISVLLEYAGFSLSEQAATAETMAVIGVLSAVGVGAFILLWLGYRELFRIRGILRYVPLGQRVGSLFGAPLLVISLCGFLYLLMWG